ncbi:MAG TPA: choloylglycine hydrolase, partial [Ruminococcaceae bacterium]|nr:choloylglycine hydrolase [Oscillospiraceae bacterium]
MKARKIIGRVLLIIAIVLAVIVTIAFFMFRNELISLSSLQQKTQGVYTMTYSGDYGFDEFLKVGAKSDKDIENFVAKRLLKGLPIEINVTGAGCTCFVSRNEENDVIFCRNFDFSYAPMLQVHTKPDNGYASVSTVNLAFAGYGEDNLP